MESILVSQMAKRSRKATDRYSDILDMAEEVILKEGPHAVKTNDIAKLVGSSTSTVYKLFKDSNEILSKVFERLHHNYYKNIENNMPFAKSAQDELITMIEESFSYKIFTEKNTRVWLAYWAYLPYGTLNFNYRSPEYEACMNRTIRVFSELGVKNPFAAEQFWTHIDGIWLKAAADRTSFDRHACLELAYNYVEAVLNRELKNT